MKIKIIIFIQSVAIFILLIIVANDKFNILNVYKFVGENCLSEEVIAYRYHYREAVPVKKQNVSINGVEYLPEEFVINPGKYIVCGAVYDFSQEGVYRFITPENQCIQRISWGGYDIDSLMSSICWIEIHTNGKNDDIYLNEQLDEIVKDRILKMTCGNISLYTQHLLSSLNINSRIVLGMTIDEWNNYDNGHTLIEVFVDREKEWILYDVDNNCKFYNKNNKPLSIYELSNIINSGEEYEIEFIATDPSFNSSYDIGTIDFLFYSEHLSGEQNLRKWYDRVMQVPLIADGNMFYYPKRAIWGKLINYSSDYIPVEEREFCDKYYVDD